VTRRLIAAMTALVAIVALALAIPLSIIVNTDERDAFVAQLEIDTLTTASLLSSRPSNQWQSQVEVVAARTGARVVVVDLERQLIADSDRTDTDRMFDRVEIDQALRGLLASNARFSQTLDLTLRYVAAPVVQDEKVVAAVRLSIPDSEVVELVNQTRWSLAGFVGAVVVSAALLAWILAYSIATPLRRVAEVADDLADNLDHRAREDDGPIEVRSVARALNRTAARLSTLIRRQERVAEDASHHLRTPLTGVRLRVEAIEDLAPTPQLRAEASAAIVEIDRLTRRIEQILALARSDAGSDLGRVDLCEVVRQRVAALQPQAQEAHVRIEVNLPSDTVLVLAGESAAARVLDELLGNAMAYAASVMVVTVTVDGEFAQITVADDGPGISADEFESIFERFARGVDAAAGGSGLGLALVRETARSVGGDAWAQQGDLGGLAVTTRWPLLP